MKYHLNNMSETQVLSEFKNNLISFFDELIGQYPTEGDLIRIRIYIKDQKPIEDIIDVFTHYINKNDQEIKKMVKARNETFFLQNNMFDFLGKVKILHFKKLWRSEVDDEDKKIMWSWMDSFIYLSDKYIKLKEPRTS